MSKHNTAKKKLKTDTSTTMLIGLLSMITLISYLTLSPSELPQVLPADSDHHLFSESRAWVHMDMLDRIGVRHTGSYATEVVTVEYLLGVVQGIKDGARMGVRVDVEVQMVSGSFFLDFLEPFNSVYNDIRNVLVRVVPDDRVDDDAVLLSAHYDSSIGSPAISDNGINVAILLEILRAISVSEPLKHTVVFNFNGAEETILQGAHGFITQHPWSKDIVTFMNLEGAGGSGKELAFQIGPSNGWLVQAYSQVPHPYALVIAQEIFESGIIPSDTDFRMYRDYGEIPGIDVAFVDNGYIYHTHLDTASRVVKGSLQNSGENMLSFLREITSSDVLDPNEHSKEFMVFYTILKKYLIVYPNSIALVVNFSSIIISLFVAYKRVHSHLKLGIWAITSSVLVGILVPLLLGVLFTFFHPLSWYGQPYLVVGLFFIPSLLGMIMALRYYRKTFKKLGFSDQSIGDIVYFGTTCIFSFFLFLGTLSKIGSVYIFTHYLLWPAVAYLINSQIPKSRYKLRSSIFVAFYFIPSLITAELTIFGMRFFMPLAGRSGNRVPFDIVIGAVSGIFTVLNVLPLLEQFYLIKISKLKWMMRSLTMIFFLSVILSAVSNPFHEEAPKRVYIQHIEKIYHGKPAEASIWINTLDFTGSAGITSFLEKFHFKEGICSGVYCDFPYPLPIKSFIDASKSLYYETQEKLPRTEKRPIIKTHTEYNEEKETKKVHFNISGPPRMNLYARGDDILSWSLGVVIVGEDNFVYYSSSHELSEWNFWIEIRGQAQVEIALAAHYLDSESPILLEIISSLPKWTDPIGWLSVWEKITI